MEVISSKIKKDEEEGGVAGEWKYAAMVMDRSGDDFNQHWKCMSSLKPFPPKSFPGSTQLCSLRSLWYISPWLFPYIFTPMYTFKLCLVVFVAFTLILSLISSLILSLIFSLFRLCLVVFLAFTLILSLAVFCSAPHVIVPWHKINVHKSVNFFSIKDRRSK